MATMKEVAEVSGVSVATVSRYINKSGYVSEDAAAKIQKVIDDFDYRPNEVARSLFQKQSKLIGVLIPDITNPFFNLLAESIENVLKKTEYKMILATVENAEQYQSYINNFESNNVAGVISVIEDTGQVHSTLPIVSLDRFKIDDKFIVISDDYAGGKLAAESVLERHARKIAIINGPTDMHKSKERLKGILSVLETTDKDITFKIFYSKSFGWKDSKSFANEIFDDLREFDTIISSNDINAVTIMRTALEHGIKIPEELQIIGYDNIEMSKIVYPSLSTIAQPVDLMGKESVELLMEIINKHHQTSKHIKLPVTLIQRESLRQV